MFTKAVIATLLLIVAVFCAQAQTQGQNWAVLVAGSNGYWNYRHQSDVCHAFQILKKNGIPAENIIVMMYDDIANNSQNPKKGTIINIPGGPNVYTSDLPKDYTGNQVTPENFLKVLRGEIMSVGSRKTLKSGPNDKVFVYWTDHGGPGILGFPNGALLHAKDLISTLKFMNDNKKYKELVFYLEACESGSMFNNLLPTDWNIYVTTASNPYESSYACFYDSTYNAYLNDCYSIYWMNNTEFSDVNKKTLQTQFNEVKTQTTQSHVCQYGDLTIASETLSAFQAGKQKVDASKAAAPSLPRLKKEEMVDSRVAKRAWILRNIEQSTNSVQRVQWQKELALHDQQQTRADVIWGSFAFGLKLKPTEGKKFSTTEDHCHSQLALDVECLKDAYEVAMKACGAFDEVSFKYTDMIRDACEAGYTPEEIGKQLNNICAVVPQL